MSATQSKEERRNLRRQIGETAASAMAECKAAVFEVRTSNFEHAQLLARQEKRISELEQRVGAAMKLGFDNEKKVGDERTHRIKLAGEQRGYVDREDGVTRGEIRAHVSMTFIQRLRWLFTGSAGRPWPDPAPRAWPVVTDPIAKEAFFQDIGRP